MMPTEITTTAPETDNVLIVRDLLTLLTTSLVGSSQNNMKGTNEKWTKSQK